MSDAPGLLLEIEIAYALDVKFATAQEAVAKLLGTVKSALERLAPQGEA